jgi:hypothetical protein
MKNKRFFIIGTFVISLLALTTIAMMSPGVAQKPTNQDLSADPPCSSTVWVTECVRHLATNSQVAASNDPNLVQAARQAADRYKDVAVAEADGYGMFLGCVSGPQGGAMGVHYPNGSLVGDGALDPMYPEALVYEVKNGKYELAAVEYLVLVEDWHENNEMPPALMGQVFNYVGSPNRYGMPAFYKLHVWAWKNNPSGVFADWNPNVSCEGFTN